MTRLGAPLLRLIATLLLLLVPSAAGAEVSAAPDITVDLSGVTVDDDEVAIDDLMGGIALESFGGLPPGVAVDAYHDLGSGEVLFSTDATATLGTVTAAPEDVVRFDGSSYSLEFDGSAEGVPAGANVDAVTRDGSGDLVLSFDTTLTLDSVTYSDEDLTRFDGATFSSVLDASAEGFDPALDLDAVQHRAGDVYALSFDGNGNHAGVDFADEDVVSFDPSGPTTTLVFDASAAHTGWNAADLQALPEPGVVPGIFAAGVLLRLVRRRR